MAFGTGHHESTRLAARGIRAAAGLLGSCRSLLDVGAGSGVLCFYGALLGFGPCLGVEIDPCCRESLSANLRDNPVPEGVRLVVGDVACVRPRVRFGVIAMNMIYPEAAPLLSGLTQRLEKQGGAGLWSGLLTEGRQEACEAAKRARLTLAQEFAENEWWAGLFSLSGGDA